MRFKKNRRYKVDLLTVNMLDYAMDKDFLAELQEKLRHLSQDSIANDVLNGAYNRESLSKAKYDITRDIQGHKVLAIAVSIYLRDCFEVKPKIGKRRMIKRSELKMCRDLLESYGVILMM